jgi:hypothetical protein
MPRINRGMVYLGACLIAGIRLAREKQVNVRVIPTSRAVNSVLRRPFCLALILFGLGVCSAKGTATAIIREDTQIVVATDSRVVDLIHVGKSLPDACKIRSAGTWHFTLNGEENDRLFALLNARLESEGTLSTKVESIRTALLSLLKEPPFNAPSAFLKISIFGYEDGVLKLAYLQFAIDNHGDVTSKTDISSSGPYHVIAPYKDSQWLLSRVQSFPVPVETVRGFVQMEIDKGLPTIGGPIQMLRIDATGKSTWLSKPDVCKDQN